MFSKRYITFKQTLDNFAKKWIFSWIQDGDWLIRDITSKYSITHKPKNHIAFFFFKYFVLIYILWLIAFSFSVKYTLPSYESFSIHQETCILHPNESECKKWIYPFEKEDNNFIETQYKTWVFYVNILTIILYLTYLPYKIYFYYKDIKLGDISILYWIKKIIYLLISIKLLAFTWWFGNWFASMLSVVHASYAPIIYEIFWSLTIPWII